MLIHAESRVELFPLHVERYGDAFRVIRKGGRSVMATRQEGVEALGLLQRGLSLREVREELARRHDTSPDAVNVRPLLDSLRKANLIRRVDGRVVGRDEATPGARLRFFWRFSAMPRLRAFSRTLPVPLHRRVLHVVDTLEQWKPTRGKRQRARANMAAVLPAAAGVRLDRLAADYYRHLIWNIVDAEALIGRSPEEIDDWFARHTEVRGLEHLERARRSGRGVLICGFHFSCTRLIPFLLARRGCSLTTMGAINLHLGRAALDAQVEELRARFPHWGRIEFVDNLDLRSVSTLVRRLREGGTVFSSPDMYSLSGDEDDEVRARSRFFGVVRSTFPRSAVPVRLFGHAFEMTEWLGWLAAGTGAPVVPLVLVRSRPGRLEMTLEPPLQVGEAVRADRARVQEAVNREVARTLERWVARFPSQWFGWHNLHKLGLAPVASGSGA
jgi:lauroyl/myristoyl acyltransferase